MKFRLSKRNKSKSQEVLDRPAELSERKVHQHVKNWLVKTSSGNDKKKSENANAHANVQNNGNGSGVSGYEGSSQLEPLNSGSDPNYEKLKIRATYSLDDRLRLADDRDPHYKDNQKESIVQDFSKNRLRKFSKKFSKSRDTSLKDKNRKAKIIISNIENENDDDSITNLTAQTSEYVPTIPGPVGEDGNPIFHTPTPVMAKKFDLPVKTNSTNEEQDYERTKQTIIKTVLARTTSTPVKKHPFLRKRLSHQPSLQGHTSRRLVESSATSNNINNNQSSNRKTGVPVERAKSQTFAYSQNSQSSHTFGAPQKIRLQRASCVSHSVDYPDQNECRESRDTSTRHSSTLKNHHTTQSCVGTNRLDDTLYDESSYEKLSAPNQKTFSKFDEDTPVTDMVPIQTIQRLVKAKDKEISAISNKLASERQKVKILERKLIIYRTRLMVSGIDHHFYTEELDDKLYH